MSLSQLSNLLPLPEEELQQVLDYAKTLSKDEAADHFGNLLGDSPAAIEFISSFNSRRQDPKIADPPLVPSPAPPVVSSPSGTDIAPVPKPKRSKKKAVANIHTPAPRQLAETGPTPGTAYNKKGQDEDYMIGKPGPGKTSSNKSLAPNIVAPQPKKPKAPPSAAGTLISDLPKPKPKSNPVSRTSTPVSRTSTPGANTSKYTTTKVSITGGTPMHGASSALADLDAAIRTLELTTNPALSSGADPAARRCNCVGARHPVQSAAPNCLECGHVVCLKEGLGPCTFCGTPLLSSDETQAILHELKVERGRERMAVDREAHKKADVARSPAPFTRAREGAEELRRAEAHRDKLLGFQEQNARRTTVRDEAADFDVSVGPSMWASPEERARQIKRQQKLVREMEWNATPEYEKRRQVVSIDLVGGKAVRRVIAVERPEEPREEEKDEQIEPVLTETNGNTGRGGVFSRNPLLSGLVKPVYNVSGKGKDKEERRKKGWRRVQDDLDDNEGVILDGGVYGSGDIGEREADGPVCG